MPAAPISGESLSLKILEQLRPYYRDSRVRYAILEFLGESYSGGLTSRFITADSPASAERRPLPVEELFRCLDQGLEICRSLWDSDSLVAHLDIEYVNFDYPGEAYSHPERVFGLQAPVAAAVESLLGECGIEPLHILSGRGHHFVWQTSLDSAAFAGLARIGRGPPSELQTAAHAAAFDGKPLPSSLVEAFAGLSLVMEFLAHQIKELAAPACDIPVELTAVEAGPSEHGREMISIDISEYGDPLSSRSVRAPFSGYLKPWQQRDAIGGELADSLPPIIFIPLIGMDVGEGLRTMRSTDLAMELAGRCSAKIPEQTAGLARLIAGYLGSPLRRFHDDFYSQRHHPPGEWPETYDRTPVEILPCCARWVLANPNDLLLRPSGMRLITRALLALGWHPRHIAGLIRSKFERDFAWGEQWQGYDPAMRADFYTRVFAGLFTVGRDDLVNFNCQSSKEERTCTTAECPWNLEWFQQSALARRHYGYLAHRPFNRLFLPAEHL